ncbi:hypothetical protein RRG08_000818, partial [Elysia crispata]
MIQTPLPSDTWSNVSAPALQMRTRSLADSNSAIVESDELRRYIFISTLSDG